MVPWQATVPEVPPAPVFPGVILSTVLNILQEPPVSSHQLEQPARSRHALAQSCQLLAVEGVSSVPAVSVSRAGQGREPAV